MLGQLLGGFSTALLHTPGGRWVRGEPRRLLPELGPSAALAPRPVSAVPRRTQAARGNAGELAPGPAAWPLGARPAACPGPVGSPGRGRRAAPDGGE